MDNCYSENELVYHGQLSEENGMRHGLGVLIHQGEQYSYCGQFSQGVREGFGKLETQDYVYIGDWVAGERSGIGYYSSESGSYFGHWSREKREGLGISTTPTVRIYSHWAEDLPTGISVVYEVELDNFYCGIF